MIQQADVWDNIPGTRHENAEIEYRAELDEVNAEEADERKLAVLRLAREHQKGLEARELAARFIAKKAALERGPFSSRVLDMQGVRELEAPKHLMRDILYTGSVAVFLGNSQVGKSWLLQAIASCAASGLDWPNMTPNSKGRIPTLYVAAEDGGAIRWRLEHWERAHTREIPNESLYTHPEPVNMLDEIAVEEIIDFVGTFQVRLVIIDTISATLGGQEENNENFAKLVRLARSITKAMAPHGGGSVAFAHHFGKDQEKGGRGGSSLFNDADIVWEMTGLSVDDIKLTNKKWKVDEQRRPYNLRLDRTDRSAVHLVECHPQTGQSITVSENRFVIMERHILAIVGEFSHLQQGFGITQKQIKGKLRDIEGFHASNQDIEGKIEAMALDRKVLTQRRGPAVLYRLPPTQEEIPQ